MLSGNSVHRVVLESFCVLAAVEIDGVQLQQNSSGQMRDMKSRQKTIGTQMSLTRPLRFDLNETTGCFEPEFKMLNSTRTAALSTGRGAVSNTLFVQEHLPEAPAMMVRPSVAR